MTKTYEMCIWGKMTRNSNNLTDDKLVILDQIGKLINIKTEEEFHQFHDWVEIIFSSKGLVGLDNVDVYAALKNKKIELNVISGKDLEEIKENISLNHELSCCILGIELPLDLGLDEIHTIGENVTAKLNENAQVIWQAINKDVDKITVYVMRGE